MRLAAGVAAALLISAAGWATKPAPPRSAEQAFAEAQAAAKAKKYDHALRLYNQIVKQYRNSQFEDREFAARSLFETAKIQARNKKTRYAAYESLRRLSREYRDTRYPVVQDAETFKHTLAAQMDKDNSKHILYKTIDAFVALTGRHSFSYWIAIILITVLVRILTWPMQTMQLKAMKQMQSVQPLIKDLQKKYKDNQQELGRKVMELYKEHKINPFASCLPLLIQMPILWALYYTIRLYEFQFQNGTFLWISPALHKLTPFIAGNLAERDIPLVIIYTISMYVTQKLTPVDPTQADQQRMMSILMPLMFGYLFGVLYEFPSAFMLYWLVFNIMQIIQQYYTLRTPAAPAATATAPPEAPEPEAEAQPRRPRPRRRRR